VALFDDAIEIDMAEVSTGLTESFDLSSKRARGGEMSRFVVETVSAVEIETVLGAVSKSVTFLATTFGVEIGGSGGRDGSSDGIEPIKFRSSEEGLCHDESATEKGGGEGFVGLERYLCSSGDCCGGGKMNGGTRVRSRIKIGRGAPESIPKELNICSGPREGE